MKEIEIKTIKYKTFDGTTFVDKVKAEEYEKKTKNEIIQRVIEICSDNEDCRTCPFYSKNGDFCLISDAKQLSVPEMWNLSGD